MPVITQPPIFVDPVNLPDGPNDTQDALIWGPVTRPNGNQYCFVQGGPPPSRPDPRIYESTDGGATWTDITGLAPALVGYFHVWDPNGPSPSIITLGFLPTSPGSWNLADFDVDTGTWSAVYGLGGGPPTNVTARNPRVMVRRSNGDIVFFGQANGTTDSKFWVCAAGGDWTVSAQPASFGGTSVGVVGACVNYPDDRVCFIYDGQDLGLGNDINYNSLDNTNTLGTPEVVKFVPDPIVPHIARIYIDGSGNLRIGELSFAANTVATFVGMLTGTGDLAAPVWTETLVADVSGMGPFFGVYAQFALEIAGVQWILVFVADQSTFPSHTFIYFSKLVSGAWTPLALYYDSTANPPTDWTGAAGPFLQSLGAASCGSLTGANVIVGMDSENGDGNTAYVLSGGCPAPVPTIVPGIPRGARRTISLTDADFCLYRNYRLYEQIDPLALSCARKPSCFCTDERDWYGENWNEDEEIGKGPPKLAVAFNPFGSVTLPAPADGDVIVFKFIVPYGYDGIILGQFHGYYQTPTLGIIPPNFIQGSGDIQWRISANDRFVKDCGNMLVALGTLRSQSPIAGGIQLRSGDLVRYIVNVPNLSGTLNPGLGSILAGLHGYFYPRK